MKKVLSVLLAAAMVMGMSVSAFAAKTWVSASTDDLTDSLNDTVAFHNQVWAGEDLVAAGTGELEVEPGDKLYFPLVNAVGTADAGKNYTGEIDKDWSINIKTNGLVESAKFYTVKFDATKDDADKETPWGQLASATVDMKYIEVVLSKDVDLEEVITAKFEMYLADNENKEVSETIKVEAAIEHVVAEKEVDFVFTNFADKHYKWTAEEKGTAYFDFKDNAFVTVKMLEDEVVYLNLSTSYDKEIDKKYNDYDADLSFYNFKGNRDNFSKTAELFIEAKEDTFIYEIVDGELVAVDAEWVEDYKYAKANKMDGWVIETKELGYYVVADEELVIEEEVVEAPVVEDNKANPETGANDFVGAAVALAVVSVAAAGALALKK